MENNPKSQVIERLKEAQNVLITVSNNPSVDQLSAAVGFTVMMNKLGKHATAVFSGKIPSTLEFLKPEETLEQNTDSLRDFIISLDKSKADKLRYKVEEDVVKIFITPYKTSLSEQDLDFSQGDFNVDVVIALGVDERDHIDQAIISHGRILHDATVIGVMAGQAPLDVGSINWQDPAASSLCEMLVSISEAFQSGLLDTQMATAFLTGIVAETDRFSNSKTSPKVMTMSAQLMAAGANQQLIANQLTTSPELDNVAPTDLPAPADIQEIPLEQNNGELSVQELNTGDESQDVEVELENEPALQQEETHEINIDDQGTLRHANDVAEPAEEQVTKRETNLNRGVTIEPPKHDFADGAPAPNFAMEPPKVGGTLEPSTPTEPTNTVDPLGGIPQGMFPAPDYSNDAKKLVQDTNKSATASTESDFDSINSPDPYLGPQITPDKTLSDIEKTVGVFRGDVVHPNVNMVPDADAARQAVLDAVGAQGFDANRPKPLESIGSQPLSGEPEPPKIDNTAPMPAPPSVPPPFPMPNDDGNLQV
jgi:hypothetical protein